MEFAHFMTGGTGFVGAALILELLTRNKELHVVCLVRPGKDGATARLQKSLREAAAAYETPSEVLADISQRCHAVDGDVSLSGCSVTGLPRFRYRELWHSAASLNFEDRYADEIFRINTEGTKNTLELGHRLEVEQFNYMSTAYVAGNARGLIKEESCKGAQTNNLYEQSKVKAEALVEAETAMGKRIFRPSIVIGHSRTHAATNFTGMYGFLRKLYAFQGMMARTQKGMMQETRLRLLGEADIPINLVPVDAVACNAVTIAAKTNIKRGETQYYHLTNPTPPLVGDVVNLMFEMNKMLLPHITLQKESFEWLDEKFNSRIDFYRSYMQGHKQFDRSASASLIGDEPSERYAMEQSKLAAYYRWYLSRLEEERSSMPETR